MTAVIAPMSSAEMDILRARANDFLFSNSRQLSFEHGSLPDHVDICLALGVVSIYTALQYCDA